MRSVLALAPFRRLALTYTLNELGDWLATVTLAVLVYDRTGDALATTALFLAAKFLPSFVVPVLAARAERLPVAPCLTRLYVGEGLVFALLAVVASDPWVPLVCALAFVDGTIAATGRAITRAATVAILEPAGRLREGNAVLNLGFSAMSVAGPALAGFLVAGVGASAVLAATAAVFGAMGLVMATARDTPGGAVGEEPFRERLRAGAAYVWSHPVVRPLVIAQGVLLVLFTMVAPIEIVYAKESLHGGDTAYGTLLTGWGSGVIVGSLIFARVHGRSLAALVGASTLVIGIAYLGMAAAPSLAVATVAAVLGGLGNGMQWVVVVTAMQEAVASEMQGRVAGFFEAVATGLPGLGFLLGGVLTAALSPRVAFAVAGAGVVVVVSAGGLLFRLRRRSPARVVVALRADLLTAEDSMGGPTPVPSLAGTTPEPAS
jgi:MFS family permease